MNKDPGASAPPGHGRSGQRVLLVHRFFSPDVTTYALMLDAFARHLREAGHEVVVIAGPPSYNDAYKGGSVSRREHKDGYEIRRLRIPRATGPVGKILGSLLFPFGVLSHIVTRQDAYDVVSVTTMPPVVMGLAARLGKLRSPRMRVIYHCMDLYPEAALALGLLRPGLLSRLVAFVDSKTAMAADRVIVLSEDMAHTLRQRAPKAQIAVCNNFILADHTQAADVEKAPADTRMRFIFAGNLGRFQGLENLIEAIRLTAAKRDDFVVEFLGAGRLEMWLTEQAATGLPIEVNSFRPLLEAMTIIERCDAAIVSLSPGVITAAYPSKTLLCLEMGVPIFAMVEPESQLARTVESRELGLTAPPDDAVKASTKLCEMIDNRGRWEPRVLRRNGRELFGRNTVLEHWTQLYGLGHHE